MATLQSAQTLIKCHFICKFWSYYVHTTKCY